MQITRLTLLAACLTAPAFSQDLTILLQRGIYLEETVGDLDGAIQVYRQIIAAGPNRAWEAEAQYHLGNCLLRKGDRKLAARTFGDLMVKHPEDTVLIGKASVHYVDPDVGYSFTAPNGWIFHTRRPYNGGPGECTDFQDPENQGQAIICAKGDIAASSNIDSRLSAGELAIVKSRLERSPDYVLRPGSPSFGWLEGQRTLTILADYTITSVAWTEWTTWVETEKTRASVVVYVPKSALADFQARFTPILNSFRIP